MAPSIKTSKPPPGKDIRGFFGGPSQQKSSQSNPYPTPKPTQGKKPGKKDVIEIADSDDEIPAKKVTVPTPAKVSVSKASSKPPLLNVSDSEDESPVKKPTAKRKVVVADSEEEDVPPKKKSAIKRKKPAALISSDDEEEDIPPKKKPVAKPRASVTKAETPKVSKPRAALISSDDEEDDIPPKKKPAAKPRASVTKAETPKASKPRASTSKDETPTAAKRKKATALLSSDDEEESPPKKKAAVASSFKSKSKPRASAVKSDEKKPTNGKGKEKERDEEEPKKAKPNWAAIKAAKLAAPVARGSKEIPDADFDCLAGLCFVFTGELSSFSRDEATDLAKRFGGRVVGQPSSKTDYVILGEGAGAKKIEALKRHNIKTLNEDEFLNLIGTRKGPSSSGKMDDKTRKKMEKEQAAIKSAAKEMEKQESKGKDTADLSSQLWTTRYAPQNLKDICGNKGQVEKLEQWLKEWPKSLRDGFKKPGKNAMNVFRAVLITGSPGIGKTTSAHLCAKLAGYTPIELNASDTRSKKLVESGMNINNTSLDGYIGGGKATNALGITITDRSCLIMDEVDGMSAGDRGGVGALNALIKKTKVPIICIANDKNAQKLKPLLATCFNMTFQKPPAQQIRSRILSIVYKEKLKIPATVVDQLITGAQSDIRQVLNMLSTWKLSSDEMTFDESKNLTKMNEKYTIMSPFDITSKMLGPYLFSHTSRETLGDKMELYFQDHSFMPLFIQENYLKTQPAKLRNLAGPDYAMEQLRLMDKAASSLSDGDLVDGLIHGPEQHWSLMPLHAVCSTVRPASFMYGAFAGYGSGGMSFPQWLGQNSKQTKLSRQLSEVQTRMRLRVSGDKAEIRQSYIPALFPHIVSPLVETGASMIDDVISVMDEYYLSKEDWDTIVELGVGDKKDDVVLKKISTGIKTSFTRKYNSTEHPIPFYKAQDLGKPPKKLAGGPAPDIEDAFELDDVVVDDTSDSDEKPKKKGDEVTNDKLIKAPKKKAANGKAKK